MKRIFILFILFIIGNCVFSQNEKTLKYQLNGISKNIVIDDTHVTVFCSGIYKNDRPFIYISDDEQLQEFRVALSKTFEKYKEWVRIAKENNITELDKNVDIEFPSVNLGWFSSLDVYFDLYGKIRPSVLIKNGIAMLYLFRGKELTSARNEYITTVASMGFKSEYEISNFLLLISSENISRIRQQISSTQKRNDELFK